LLHQSGAEVYLLDLDGAEAAAAELGPRGGFVAHVSDSAAVDAAVAAGIPMGRFAAPAEMAAAMAFLASEEAGYVTGTVLPVDGGLSM
jgi:hypothetical protein